MSVSVAQSLLLERFTIAVINTMNDMLGFVLISTLFGSSVLMFLMMTLRFDTSSLSDAERQRLLFGFGYRQRSIVEKCLGRHQLRLYWALRELQGYSLGVSCACLLLNQFTPFGQPL